MRFAETEVQQLLSKNQQLMTRLTELKENKDFPNVFLGSPDLTNYSDSELSKIVPYIRVTLVPDDEAVYADDERFMEFPSVQIDFWVQTRDINSYKEISELIYKIMTYVGWERNYFNSYVDRDVKSLRMITTRYKYIG